MPSLVDQVDRAIGDGIERAVCGHHRRRLRRVGWEGALDADPSTLWAGGTPPPREGNDLEVLIDGEEALPRIAEALQAAESHVHIAGWFVSPHFALTREGRRSELRDLLAELAERLDVRVLVWAGSPLPMFRPDRSDVERVRHGLTFGTKIRFATDDRERPMHCHHEKLVVVDDRIAFVGGIDLTTMDGDRFDWHTHPARGSVGWHDAATVLRGPAVKDVADHFSLRWREVTGEVLSESSAPASAGSTKLQIVRTVPEHIYDALPNGDFRILEAYLRALRSAQRLVYLENQFLWSPEIVAVLRDKLANPPCDEFRVVAVLPMRPNSGGDDTRGQLAQLAEADAGAGRLVASTIYALRGEESEPVYVHAKVGIVDDSWLTIGSANLNEHSLFNDSEVNVVTCDADLARATRLRLWAEHLECDPSELEGEPHRVLEERWKPRADEQLARREREEPLTHRLVRLPHLSGRSRRLLGPLQGLLVDG